ncbi:MAG TPA: GNAT family N-acetyltransferase [Bacillota bacterium]|nr:GNAT family N-acetyltransferase [Bacillota bacterium]
MVNSYEFSLAEQDDIPQIINIYHSLIGTPGCTWSLSYPNRETAESDLDSNSLYVLKKNGTIIAVASLGEFNELEHLQWTLKVPCELARIGVIPTLHRQGIGSTILKNIIKTAKQKGFDGIRMLVSKCNPSALALYNKNGFKKCGEVNMHDNDFYCYQIKI